MKKFIRRQDSTSLCRRLHRSDNSCKPRRLPAIGRLAVYEFTLLTVTTGGRLDPSEDEKATVMSRGQITKRQLENWLSNCRRRLFRSNPSVIEDKARKEIEIARRELKSNVKRRDPIFDDDDRRRPKTSLADESSSDPDKSVVYHCTRSHTSSKRHPVARHHAHPVKDCISVDTDDSDDVPDFKVRHVNRLSAKGNERRLFRSNVTSTPTLPFEFHCGTDSGHHPSKNTDELFREARPAWERQTTLFPELVAESQTFHTGRNGFSVLMSTLAMAAELIERPEHSANCQLEARYLGETNCYVCRHYLRQS